MGIIVTTHRPPRSTVLQTRKETFRHPERWPRSLSSGERAGVRADHLSSTAIKRCAHSGKPICASFLDTVWRGDQSSFTQIAWRCFAWRPVWKCSLVFVTTSDPGLQTAIIFMSKRILFFASDAVEREAIRTELCADEEGWEKCMTSTFDEAVAALEPDTFDAIVVAHHEDKSSAKLLNWAAKHHPKVARLIVADSEEREDGCASCWRRTSSWRSRSLPPFLPERSRAPCC